MDIKMPWNISNMDRWRFNVLFTAKDPVSGSFKTFGSWPKADFHWYWKALLLFNICHQMTLAFAWRIYSLWPFLKFRRPLTGFKSVSNTLETWPMSLFKIFLNATFTVGPCQALWLVLLWCFWGCLKDFDSLSLTYELVYLPHGWIQALQRPQGGGRGQGRAYSPHL